MQGNQQANESKEESECVSRDLQDGTTYLNALKIRCWIIGEEGTK